MSRRRGIFRPMRKLARDESGATLVEFGLTISMFLLIMFGLIDFGRLAFNWVVAERAVSVAARVSAVRPPVCAGVPLTHARGPVPIGTVPPRFGTSCSAGANICVNVGTITCSGVGTSTTATEIWGIVQGALPQSATIANLRFAYAFDQNLGFLGGPYVPMITVELQNLNFTFVSPLSTLVGLTGGIAPAGLGAVMPFPPMSVSLPGEDLALGTAG